MKRFGVVVVFSVLSAGADARVLSYSPVTDRSVIPAVQHRANRHYALIEVEAAAGGPVGPAFAPCAFATKGKLVVHDSLGLHEPRAVYPTSGEATLSNAAALEVDGGLRLLVQAIEFDGNSSAPRTLYSSDGGSSWLRVAVPAFSSPPDAADVGGPLARGAGSQLLPGTGDVPFVLAVSGVLFGIEKDGAVRRLAAASNGALRLVGSDRGGTRFVILGQPVVAASTLPYGFYSVDLAGKLVTLLETPPGPLAVTSAWLAPSGALYFDWIRNPNAPADFGLARSLFVVERLKAREIASALIGTLPVTGFFTVPTADFEGAWIVQRGPGLPTTLARYLPESGLITQWSDATGPELEAVHAGVSGDRLLLQVHRPRPQADQRIFRDPALAVWRVGEPAPRSYDELFLAEQSTKGFVHLDVDAVAAGTPFVFDSGSGAAACYAPPAGGGASPGPGGADVVQEWGAVRASLRQTLVVPAVAKSPGAFGSDWTTELLVYNPADTAATVNISFLPSGAEVRDQRVATLTLAPGEIRVVPDVLGSLFQLGRGNGALLLQPEGDAAVAATSRTTTNGPGGSFGMGMGALEVFTAAGPRFPLVFSAALLGNGFRTNLTAVDASGRGLEAALRLTESELRAPVALRAPAGGQAQLNDLGALFDARPWDTGSMTLETTSGTVLPALIVIDNRTNDPTYFPPDLPASTIRTIPALVHADGAGGARFRSDLVISNPGGQLASVTLAAKRWSSNEQEKLVTLTLLPHESKVVGDALTTIFGLSGVARLRYVSGASLFGNGGSGVRVTSRTYTLLPDGGTYGLLIPPLNSFQSAGSGEALEILGARGGTGFRTNLSLVELTAFSDGSNPRVAIEVVDGHGKTIDSFETTVPLAGGRQIDDLFRSRGLGDGPEAALIRVRPFGGLVAAYATLIDQGTNDPVYLPAGLASR